MDTNRPYQYIQDIHDSATIETWMQILHSIMLYILDCRALMLRSSSSHNNYAAYIDYVISPPPSALLLFSPPSLFILFILRSFLLPLPPPPPSPSSSSLPSLLQYARILGVGLSGPRRACSLPTVAPVFVDSSRFRSRYILLLLIIRPSFSVAQTTHLDCLRSSLLDSLSTQSMLSPVRQ